MPSERILIWYSKGRVLARQGVHSVSAACDYNPVRDGEKRKRGEFELLRSLYEVKRTVQQMRRPPAKDSRPRACHARYKGERLVCQRCSMAWGVKQDPYPACQGDNS